jgi:cyclohexyl-isocyanide hydratase
MKIAFFTFPRMTMLDFVGVYDPLRRLRTMGIDPSVSWRVIGTERIITDDSDTRIEVDSVYETLDSFDLLVVPGGHGARHLEYDTRCIDYLRTWGSTRRIASVCTGALLLGAAGYLRGRRATTHFVLMDRLAVHGATAVSERIVDDGLVTTAAGVSAALDLGLHLVEQHAGPEARRRIAMQMEYADPHRAPSRRTDQGTDRADQ